MFRLRRLGLSPFTVVLGSPGTDVGEAQFLGEGVQGGFRINKIIVDKNQAYLFKNALFIGLFLFEILDNRTFSLRKNKATRGQRMVLSCVHGNIKIKE
jgi:hypothetical protein